MKNLFLTLMFVLSCSTAFAAPVVVTVPEMPFIISVSPSDGFLTGSGKYVFASTIPDSKTYVISYNFASISDFYNTYASNITINSAGSYPNITYQVTLFTAAAPSAWPAFLDVYAYVYQVTPVSPDYELDTPALSLEQYSAVVLSQGLAVPPDSLKVLLSSIDSKMDVIIGDQSSNDSVPASLQGKITGSQFNALMGFAAVFCAFTITIVWSKGF